MLLVVPLVSLALLMFVTLLMTRLELQRERGKLRAEVDIVADQLSHRLESVFLDRLAPLHRLLRERQNGKIKSAEELVDAAASVREGLPLFRVIGWVDADGVCRGVTPLAGHEMWIGMDFNDSPEWADALRTALRQGKDAMGQALMQGDGVSTAAFIVPTFSSENPRVLLGCIFSRVDVQSMINRVLDAETLRDFSLQVSDGGEKLLRAAPNAHAELAEHRQLEVLDRHWSLDLAPTGALVAERQSRAPAWVFWGGTGSSLLIAGAAFWTMNGRLRERMQTAQQLAALESLHEISVAISQKLGSRQDILKMQTQQRLIDEREALYAVSSAVYQAGTFENTLRTIVDLAPAALKVEMCLVALVTGRENELDTLSVSQPYQGRWSRRRVVVTRERMQFLFDGHGPIVFKDAQNNPDVHASWKELPELGSVAYLRLFQSDGKPLGLLAMGRRETDGFSAEQLHFAQVFATRAAAALQNARLHQQARRDADTNAMLLRELNHRVKNNLAGIIGLLSMNQEELPASARHWLNRVVERLENMARAHELFSGGIASVRLSELVRQMLPGLPAAHAAGVQVQTDFNVDVYLRTDQAVSLAMVLHELCYNAIVHGLSENGVLLIRSRVAGENRIAVEIIDDGSGRWEQDIEQSEYGSAVVTERKLWRGAVRTSGLGLELVRGLVTRELHGTFSRRVGPNGGTTATVEFQDDGAQGTSI